MNLMIYGAKSLALGMCRALQELYPKHPVKGFLVSSKEKNPHELAGLPVIELENYHSRESHILIATPEDLHGEIVKKLEQNGFFHYTCMDSQKEAALMEQYYSRRGDFLSIHQFPLGEDRPRIQVYLAKFHRDRVLKDSQNIPIFAEPIQVGADLTTERVAQVTDHTGENISSKNVNYCELTALYWIWKNQLCKENGAEYYGLYQYRRLLELNEEDIGPMKANQLDVDLSLPTMHEPDIREHHTRYVKESDWEAMVQALFELEPEYGKAYEEVFAQHYFYNYNMLVARRQVLADYCGWLFPLLERVEALSEPKGWERRDRYIGYLGENLMTLYFLANKKHLKIAHTGRQMKI